MLKGVTKLVSLSVSIMHEHFIWLEWGQEFTCADSSAIEKANFMYITANRGIHASFLRDRRLTLQAACMCVSVLWEAFPLAEEPTTRDGCGVSSSTRGPACTCSPRQYAAASFASLRDNTNTERKNVTRVVGTSLDRYADTCLHTAVSVLVAPLPYKYTRQRWAKKGKKA